MSWRFAVTLLVVSSGTLYAQAPPIKLGLWESTVTTNSAMGGSRTMKIRSCYTQETWQKLLSGPMMQHEGCTINSTRSGNTFSFTGSCSMNNMTMTLKGSSTARDEEHITGESHTTSNVNGNAMQSDSQSEGHFVSADCGSVKPGKPEFIR